MPVDAKTELFVVITDFNGYEQSKRCLAALQSSRHRDFRIVVVDHGTTSETGAGLEADFPDVIRLPASSDLWWTGATNRGIDHALGLGAKAIMLLNNDCYVTPETIGTLLSLWLGEPEAIIAPMQREWSTGKLTCISPRSLLLLGFPMWIGPRELSPAMRSRALLPVKLINGGRGVIIPAAVFARNGLFDERRLPHYGADHDFYLRARKNGIRLYTATEAIIDVDQARTSLANDPGRLRFGEFIETLHSIRSHRNIPHMTQLFRMHYPVKHLHMLGVMLCTGRYFAVYLFRRLRLLLASRSSDRVASPR